MNIERLQHLESLLRRHAAKEFMPDWKFDMQVWEHHHCQTAGCAIGFALHSPEFQAAGLRGKVGDSWGKDVGILIFPVFQGAEGYEAVEAFFDLSPGETSWLFSSFSYSLLPSALQVADRIRGFIARGGSIPDEAEE